MFALRFMGCLLSALLLAVSACAQRVEGPYGIIGGRVADGFFYVVPVMGGVVLVDTGEEPNGASLRSAIAGRAVLAILVTHAHHDHYASASTFGDVPCYVGPADIDRMRGLTQHQGAAQREYRAQNGGRDRLPPLPVRLIPAPGGTRVTLGGADFEAIALPGHTPGSTAWRMGDVLFGGDAAMNSSTGISPIDDRFSDDPAAARAALGRLDSVPFVWLADGHVGIRRVR